MMGYFRNGWLPLLPYLLLYLWAWQYGWQTDRTTLLFQILHGLHGVLFLGICRRLLAGHGWRRLPFFGTLFLLFLLPGALFEYGADMWFQFERNFAFGEAATLAESMRPDRFGFYFGYTFFGWVEPSGRRFAMTLYGAAASTLLCYQYFRLARTLGFGELTARTSVLAVVVLTGTAQLSFFRDYAISSTLIAQTGYVALLGLLLEALRRKAWTPLILAPAALFVMAANHLQTVLFLGAILPALAIAATVHRFPSWHRVIGSALLLLFAAGSVGGWIFLRTSAQGLPENGQEALSYLSTWGSYPLWEVHTHVFVTIGLTGLLALLWAGLRFGRHPFLAAATLAPVFFLLFPPTQIPFTLFLGAYDPSRDIVLGAPHRLIFAFPLSFAVVFAIREILLRLGLDRKTYSIALPLAVLTLAMAAAPPFFGRFWNLVHQSEPIDRAYFPEAVAWFAANSERPHGSGLRTDRVSAMGIFLTTTGHGAETNVSKARIQELWPTMEPGERLSPGLVQSWKARKTAFLLIDPAIDLPLRISALGFVYPPIYTGESLRHLSANQYFAKIHLPELLDAGWQATAIPPFFLLLEPMQAEERP